jgi:hypothetical protein
MGPDDGYICQFTKERAPFWADPGALALGATLKAVAGRPPPRRMVAQVGGGGNGSGTKRGRGEGGAQHRNELPKRTV